MSRIRLTSQLATAIGTPATDNTKLTGVFFLEEDGTTGLLVPKVKDSNGNVTTLQGPPGVGLTIVQTSNVLNPTELASITITGDELFLVHEALGGTPNHQSTLYLGIASRPLTPSTPFVINDTTSGQFLAISGRFSLNGSDFEGAVKRRGIANFEGASTTLTFDATDELIALDGAAVASDAQFYSLDNVNDEIDLLKAAQYRIQYQVSAIGTASTAYRQSDFFIERATDVGAFSEISRSRSLGNLRLDRPATHTREIIINAAVNDRIRFIGRVSGQSTNSQFNDLLVNLEVIGQ